MRVTGCDWAGRVTTTTAIANGDILWSRKVSPTMVSNSRLAQLARLYEYYRVHGITFHFLSSQPTTATGSVVAYFDYDSEDQLAEAGTDANIQTAFGHLVNKTAKLFESFDLVVGPDPSRLHREKYTQPRTTETMDADLDFGALYMLALDVSNVAPPAPLFNVYVTYDIELYGPNYEASTAATAYTEMKVTPVGEIYASQKDTNAYMVLPLLHDAVSGVEAAATSCRKSYDEVRSAVGKVRGVVDAVLSAVKIPTAIRAFASAFTTAEGENIVRYGTQMLLQPGKYHAELALSACTAAGELVSGAYLQKGATAWGMDYMTAVWAPEAGDVEPTKPALAMSPFYYQPGAGASNQVVGSRDWVYVAEFEVLRTCWVGFCLRNTVAGTSVVQAYSGVSGTWGARTTFTLRNDTHLTAGVTWSPASGSNGLADEAYPYVVSGGCAYQIDVEAQQANGVRSGKMAAAIQPQLCPFVDDDYDDVRSQTSGPQVRRARV